MPKKLRAVIQTTLKIGVAVGLIAWVYSKGYLDGDRLKILFEPKHLAVCFGLVLMNLGLCHWRWLTLLRARGFDIGYIKLLPLGLIGLFFNFAIPGGVGGDLVKGFYLVKDQSHRKTDAAMTILLDRVLGLYSMFALASASVALSYNRILSGEGASSLAVFVIGFFSVFSLFLFMGWSSQVRERIDRSVRVQSKMEGRIFRKVFGVYTALQSYRQNPWAIIKAIGLSVTAQFLTVFFFWYVGSVILETNFSFLMYLFVVPVGFVVTSVPIAPGGVGVGQMAFLFLSGLYTGTNSEVGPLALTMFQILLFCFGLLGGYFYIRRGMKVRHD